MSKRCDACGRILTEEKPVRHGEMPEGHIVDDNKYAEIDATLSRLVTDLEFRSRHGLAANITRVRKWFHFHGAWMPSLPERALKPAPVATADIYLYGRDLCEHLAQKTWADEVHMDACSSNRELVREVVRLNTR
jgi:hypothetical protein